MRRRLILALAISVATFLPLESPILGARLEPPPGTILAPVGRQAAVLSLDAPRPHLLTSLQAPSYVANLDVSLTGLAAVEVRDALGSDIMRLDLTSGTLSPLVMRTDPSESLNVPFWQTDGSRLFFERDDMLETPVAYLHQANVRYPSRIETALSDGSSRTVLVDDGRMPSVTPDGSRLAYVRSSAAGTALLERTLPGGDERELLSPSRFGDVAYPRYSPDAGALAFVATTPSTAQVSSELVFGVQIAYAHGLPWDLWLIDPNGGDPRELAALGADDPSLTWSPDGHQLFVYSGSGSVIVDVTSGEIESYPYIAGYGSAAWLH